MLPPDRDANYSRRYGCRRSSTSCMIVAVYVILVHTCVECWRGIYAAGSQAEFVEVFRPMYFSGAACVLSLLCALSARNKEETAKARFCLCYVTARLVVAEGGGAQRRLPKATGARYVTRVVVDVQRRRVTGYLWRASVLQRPQCFEMLASEFTL